MRTPALGSRDSREERHGASSLFAILAAAAVILTACGSGTEDSETAVETEPSVESTETEEPDSESAEDGEPEGERAGGDYQDLEELVAAAEAEGDLVLYSNMTPTLVEMTVAAFEEAYPNIEVTAERMITSDLVTRTVQEIEADLSVVDVIQHNEEGFFDQYCEDGTLADISDLPIAELWDEEVTDEDKWNGCRAVPKAIAWGIVWNTDNVSPDEAPTSFEDLTDERWRDKMLLLDPGGSTTYTFQYSLWVEQYGWEFLDALRAQNPSYSPNLREEIAAGVHDIMCCNAYEAFAPMLEEGAPVDAVFPEGSMVTETRSGVLTNAPNPNAARLFMNWSLSPEGQEVITYAAHSQLPGIPSLVETDVSNLRSIEPGDRSDPNSEHGLAIRDRLGRP